LGTAIYSNEAMAKENAKEKRALEGKVDLAVKHGIEVAKQKDYSKEVLHHKHVTGKDEMNRILSAQRQELTGNKKEFGSLNRKIGELEVQSAALKQAVLVGLQHFGDTDLEKSAVINMTKPFFPGMKRALQDMEDGVAADEDLDAIAKKIKKDPSPEPK